MFVRSQRTGGLKCLQFQLGVAGIGSLDWVKASVKEWEVREDVSADCPAA